MKRVRKFLGSAFGKVMAFAGFLGFAVMDKVFAADSVTIPDMPVDFAEIATKAAVIMGTVIAGVIGLKIVAVLINMGIRWLGRMVG